MPTVNLTLNGRSRSLEVEDLEMPLLLRAAQRTRSARPALRLRPRPVRRMHRARDGKAMRSCVIPGSALAGKNVLTLEGLGTPEKPHPLQKAFIDEQAVQCGYCINGMIMQAKALLDTNPQPPRRRSAKRSPPTCAVAARICASCAR